MITVLALLPLPGLREAISECLTGLEGKEDMLDEGQNPIVLHIPWLTEGLLEFFLHILLPVKKINLGLLEATEEKGPLMVGKEICSTNLCFVFFLNRGLNINNFNKSSVNQSQEPSQYCHLTKITISVFLCSSQACNMQNSYKLAVGEQMSTLCFFT